MVPRNTTSCMSPGESRPRGRSRSLCTAGGVDVTLVAALVVSARTVVAAAAMVSIAAACRGAESGTVPPSIVPNGRERCAQAFGAPSTSPYVLPFPVGRSYLMFQGNCPPDPTWGHNGWIAYDFNLAIGDTVLASRGGVVTWVEQRWPDSDRICGHENGVFVTHDDGTVMVYAHFTTNGTRVTLGDRVTTGSFLGLSGDSGCSSGPHLHVNLLRPNSSVAKENTLPLNYRNASGPHAANEALVQGARYTAQSY